MKKKILIWILTIILALGGVGGACYAFCPPVTNAVNTWVDHVFSKQPVAAEQNTDNQNTETEEEKQAKQLAEYQQKIVALNTSISQLNARIGTLIESNEQQAEEIAAAVAEKATLEARLAELENANTESNEAYEAEIATLNGSISSLNLRIEELTATNQSYVDQIADYVAQIETLESQITELQAQIDELESGLTVQSEKWVDKQWNDLLPSAGSVWVYNGKAYYSNYSNQYVLNEITDTWETKTWSGVSSLVGSYVWVYNGKAYYSKDKAQYVLDETTDTWETKTWSGLNVFSGQNVLIINNKAYFIAGSSIYSLDEATDTWESHEVKGYSYIDSDGGVCVETLSSYISSYVWVCGDTVYYDGGNSHYILNLDTYTLEEKNVWNVDFDLSGIYVWVYNGKAYYSNDKLQYVFDASLNVWVENNGKEFESPFVAFSAVYIWSYNGHCYYSSSSVQAELVVA